MGFEKMDIDLAPFIGWGHKEGQHVTGYVTYYDEGGGTDFDGEPCPRLEIELTDKASSFNKENERVIHPAGTLVAVTCGSKMLAYAVRRTAGKYAPLQGKLVKIVMSGETPSDKGNPKKEFEIYVDAANSRGGGGGGAKPSDATPVADDDDPPF